MAVLFLFVDGIGLGSGGKQNPFDRAGLPGFATLAGGGRLTVEEEEFADGERLFVGVDASLGVGGLPQSGTGQAALFTGINAAREIGKHFGPFPHSGTKPLLREKSLFNRAAAMGRRAHFINAYPELFFQRSRKRERWTCTTLMSLGAGLELNGEEAVRHGRAVTAELTQKAWREMLGIDVPEIPPEEAAGRVLECMEEYDLVLHEYYLTDKVGHSRKREHAEGILKEYGRFLEKLLSDLRSGDTLVLCSDHGNLEDLSVKTHTRNRVPLCVSGAGVSHFRGAKSILDVTPSILKVLEG